MVLYFSNGRMRSEGGQAIEDETQKFRVVYKRNFDAAD